MLTLQDTHSNWLSIKNTSLCGKQTVIADCYFYSLLHLYIFIFSILIYYRHSHHYSTVLIKNVTERMKTKQWKGKKSRFRFDTNFFLFCTFLFYFLSVFPSNEYSRKIGYFSSSVLRSVLWLHEELSIRTIYTPNQKNDFAFFCLFLFIEMDNKIASSPVNEQYQTEYWSYPAVWWMLKRWRKCS